MEEIRERLDRFFVEVFHEIWKIEERSLTEYAPDLSLREFHLIEEICRAQAPERDNRSTAIAAAQRVTAGTLTTVATQLERKGYALRRRDPRDRRVVRLIPTEKGLAANDFHTRFHREMVDQVLGALTEEQACLFAGTLERVALFFRKKAETPPGAGGM